MHFHAYSWTGPGEEQSREGERRPSHPEFRTSALPPMRTCDWLLKPAGRIDASPATVADALDWLAGRYRAAEPSFLDPASEARIGLDFRLKGAEESLVHGVDVQWGIWLRAGRYVTLAVICCSPNLHADRACPVR
ncbi:hypothetical protein [Sphaerisporangium perillae]|uniref:hypothetical protein n=1 Tax=Sphaerisporangium perillae TaxID=2935860 RepID=UPI00200F3E1F|nr:hypothetical protein [Sphaerisporangium perillae]